MKTLLSPQKTLRWLTRRRPPGYILIELVIAIALFSIAVLSLAQSLNSAMETANIIARDNAVRNGMRSFIEELRGKTLQELNATVEDPTLGVTYTSHTEPITLKTTRGETLADMYDLKVVATYFAGGEQREEIVDLYVYKPATSRR